MPAPALLQSFAISYLGRIAVYHCLNISALLDRLKNYDPACCFFYIVSFSHYLILDLANCYTVSEKFASSARQTSEDIGSAD
jgi:hypothetical protein